jgi:prepilin-type N-terminal cleavage/methylation domain-containing protein
MVLTRSLRDCTEGVPAKVRTGAGFSLIEILIALAILAVVAVGVLPLFAKSMTNNVEGNQLTEVTNRSRLHVESLLSLPFDSPQLEVPAGETELETRQLYSANDERWYEEDTFPNDQVPVYSRITRVRQFSVSAISEGDAELEDDEALTGGTDPSAVHLKEIEVRVNSGPPSTLNLMGTRKTVTLRVLKSS